MQNYKMLRIPLGPGHIGIKHTPGPDYVSGEVNLQRPNPPGFLLPKGLHISVYTTCMCVDPYLHACTSTRTCEETGNAQIRYILVHVHKNYTYLTIWAIHVVAYVAVYFLSLRSYTYLGGFIRASVGFCIYRQMIWSCATKPYFMALSLLA